jgi:hypothetical protein
MLQTSVLTRVTSQKTAFFEIDSEEEEIKKYSTIYHSGLIRHENNQVTELSNPLHVKRRLKTAVALRPHSRERRIGITAHNSISYSVYSRIITG